MKNIIGVSLSKRIVIRSVNTVNCDKPRKINLTGSGMT